jgi:hypothetical protein
VDDDEEEANCLFLAATAAIINEWLTTKYQQIHDINNGQA